MKKFIVIILFFAISILRSQNARVGRAVNALKTKPDKELALALNDSSFNIRFIETGLALEFARYALPIAKRTGDKHLEATTLFNIGTAFHIVGTYDSALYYYQKAEPYFISSGDAKSIGTVYMQVALLYSDSQDPEKAISYNYKSLNYFYKAKDTVNIIGAMFNMAVFYSAMDTVLLYQKKGLKLILNFVNVEPEMKAQKLSIAYTNLGNSYQKLKQFNEAIYYFKMAIEADDHHKDIVYKIGSYENLGSCYLFMGEPKKAIAALRKGLEIGDGVEGYRTMDHIYDALALSYKGVGMIDSAYYFLRQYATFRDSINNNEQERILKEMQEKYDSNKKATEIELLNKDKQAADSFRKTLYVIIGLILIVVVALIYSYVLKQRSNKSLVQKNEEINRQKSLVEEKQKEIIDSIKYAKRIQQSLMPTGKYISKKLDELKK